jgi:hypothetical protein
MQDRVQRVTFMVLRTFVHDGVNIYRKGFRAKSVDMQLLQYVEQLQTLYAKKQTKQQMVK